MAECPSGQNWAHRHPPASLEYLKSICFSGETSVEVYPTKPSESCWGQENDPEAVNIVSRRAQHENPSVRFWACMSFSSLGPLMEFDGPETADSYLNVTLKQYLLPLMRDSNYKLIFQQDNSRLHIGKKVTKWLQDQEFSILDWPLHSADLSPLESIWTKLKYRIGLLKPRPRSQKKISKAVREIYSQLANEIGEETVKNFRSRLEACVAANGHPINNSIKVSKPNYHSDMDLDDDDTDEEYIE